MNTSILSEKRAMANLDTSDINTILQKLETTIVKIPEESFEIDEEDEDLFGKDLWEKKMTIEGLAIFERLCDPEKYQKKGVCHITGKKESLKNCAFCGKLTTKSKLTRKRKDPQNPSKYHPICEKCNTAYLEKYILSPYWKMHGKLRDMVKKREMEFHTLTDKLSKLEMDVTHIDRQIQVKINSHEEHCAILEGNKQQLNRELDKMTTVVEELSQRHEKLNRQILENQDESKKLWERHSDNRKQEDQWKDKLLAIQREIEVLNQEVDERNLALYEIRQQTLRQTNKETIFTKNYTPTILRQQEELNGTVVEGKDLKVGKGKPYGCSLI